MWIEFQSLNELERKARTLAVNLFDVLETTEKKLKGGLLPYARVENTIIVTESDFDKYPELKVIYDEYVYLSNKAFEDLGITDELPVEHPQLNEAVSLVDNVIKTRAVKKAKE